MDCQQQQQKQRRRWRRYFANKKRQLLLQTFECYVYRVRAENVEPQNRRNNEGNEIIKEKKWQQPTAVALHQPTLLDSTRIKIKHKR